MKEHRGMIHHRRSVRIGIAFVALMLGSSTGLARRSRPALMDLTRDGNAARLLTDEGALFSTFNLGPTGMRGYMHNVAGSTAATRQILVTAVYGGSPADGVVQVGDVILGVFGKPFERDARIAYAEAIGEAESVKEKGVLPLIVWRDGNEQTVNLQLRVMDSYSDTAPYDCPKSRKIFEEGLQYIVDNGNRWGRFDLEGLALLASGKPEYVDYVRERATEMAHSAGTADFVRRVEESDEPRGRAWSSGLGSLIWLEYHLATGDESVLPWIRANAINTARGQGMWGTYGHGFSLRQPNGELHGMIPPYGALNQAGLGCFLSMVLARKAGVEHEVIDAAIARSNRFFTYYTGKGTIPYGEHRPEVWRATDNNGTSGLAALAFRLQGDRREDAQFWGRMMTAGYQNREHGHSGPFFSYLWGTMGANVAGPKAAAAYFKEVAWHFDLERRWDGSFAYTQAGGTFAKWGYDYRALSSTGAYLLTYSLPYRNLYITGKDPDKSIWLDEREVDAVIASGRFDVESKGREELVESLGSWSPAERITAARELARRDGDILPAVMALAEGDDLNSVIGACHVIAHLGKKAVPSLPLLTTLLMHEDPWVRVQAGEALKTLGEAARPAVPAMLRAAAMTDERDPLRFGQGSLAYALFYPGGNVAGSPGLLAKSIEGVDKALLYPAIREISIHPDGHARGCLRSTYALLDMEDVKVLAPEIVRSVTDMAPCNTMFSKGVMLAGVQLLTRLGIEEGVPLTMQMYNWPYHGAGYVRSVTADLLKQYGGAATSLLPELRQAREAYSRRRDEGGVKRVTDVIEAIEADRHPRTLISIREHLDPDQPLRPSYREIQAVTSGNAES